MDPLDHHNRHSPSLARADSAAETAPATMLLFSIHAWDLDDDHDPVLDAGLDGWSVVSIHRATLIASESASQRLERWIAEAAAQINERQPFGPLHLVGWSLGGRMAYLVASHLKTCGRRIAFCGVIDFRGEWPSLRPASIGRLLSMVCHAKGLATKANVIRRGPVGRVRWHSAWIVAKAVPKRRRAAMHQRRPNGEFARYLDPVIESNWKVGSRVIMPRAAFVVTVFATPPSQALFRSPNLWWDIVAGEQFCVREIAGGHVTLFSPEHVQSLIAALRCSLDDASAHSATSLRTAPPVN